MAERKAERSRERTKLQHVPGLSLDENETDKLLHERMRLAIVGALAVNDALAFVELKELVHATDGNLSIHARKLENAGLIACSKGFDGRVPRTEFRLTPAGRRALERHLEHMERLLRAVRKR